MYSTIGKLRCTVENVSALLIIHESTINNLKSMQFLHKC